MAKRANGEGSIYKRTDGRWCGTVSVEGGKRKAFYGTTRAEVNKKVQAGLKSQQDGLPIVGEQLTVAEFSTQWLKSIKPSLRPSTFTSYEMLVRRHVVPQIGRVRLARLTPGRLQGLYADRLDAGLSATTVNHLHNVIHKALDQATRWSLVPRNVADLVDAPRPAHHEMQTFSPEQARAFLSAVSEDRMEALYVLAITTGMRRGELLALRWRDVNLDAGTAQVRATMQRVGDHLTFSEPKTTQSRRLVSLTTTGVAALRRHRVTQAAERLRMGAAWDDIDLVFPNEIGRPLEGSNLLRRSFFPILRRAGLPRIRFHDLRHTAATLMLGESVHPKVVAEMLGHSQISTTLDLYSHVTPTMQRQATEALDAVLNA